MLYKSVFRSGHTRRRAPYIDHRNFGAKAEARFFNIMNARTRRYPAELLEIEPASGFMDRHAYVDAIIKMQGNIRLYVDIKSSEQAVERHCSNRDLALHFVVSKDKTDEQIFDAFVRLINQEYEKAKANAAALVLAELASRPRLRLHLEAAE